MRRVSYSKFSEEDLGIEMDDLLKALADYLLQSGYQDPYLQFSEMNQHTLEQLKEAIERALQSGELFDPERMQEMRQRLQQMSAQQRDQLVQNLIDKLQESGYINMDGQPPENATAPGSQGGSETHTHFEITDKAIDFLGFKTLKDLLGSLGKSSFGAHDTRDLATGIESSGSSKVCATGCVWITSTSTCGAIRRR